ncbi:hypothetical protein MMC30_002905 [Trapelia coarctata]|nr:hypothetical protein [Trapelia coarctata]
MDYEFSRSCVVMEQLAKNIIRTPPSEVDPPFEYLDRSLTILGRTFGVHNQRMEQELLGQCEYIERQVHGGIVSKIDERFREADGRFDEMENKVDRRFEEVDRKFEEVDRRFEEMDKKMRQRFENLQGTSRNFLRTRGWEEIYPVGVFDAQGGIHTPKYFPRTVKRFWRLRDPSLLHRLTYLLQFYNVQGYEEWGTDADSHEGESDSDESGANSSKASRFPITLDMAVRSNPDIAHRALASHLGLVYDEIQKFMLRAQELGKAGGNKRNKRQQDEQTSQDGRRRRFQRVSDGGATEVTSPTEPLSSQGRSR